MTKKPLQNPTLSSNGIILEPAKKEGPKDQSILREIDYHIDVNRRVIYYTGPIDIHTAEFINHRIDKICDLTNNYKASIDLDLVSPGGDVYGMLGAIDVIRSAPVDINIIGRGMIMSAASLILMSGTGQRSLEKNSTVMIHNIRSWVEGSSSDIIAEVDHLKKLQDIVYKLYAEFSNKPKKFWASKKNIDWYLTPFECYQLGLIDIINGVKNGP